VAAIEAFVNQRENQVTEVVEVAPEKHRLLIGHGGETRRNLESQFNVNIDIPKQTVQGAARSMVKIAGQPEHVLKAKEHILSLVKGQEGETIQVPTALHHTISDNGQFFRRLRNDHKITVDHNGHQPPPKPASRPRTRVNGVGALPLITDDSDATDNHSWEVVDLSSSSEATLSGTIPWTLRGPADNIAAARALVEKALAQAQEQSCTGYLILPDPRTYRFVIGPGGRQINSIREKTGCKIDVPRDQAKGEAIEVVGSKEGVEQAREMILDCVRRGAQGGGRRGPRDE
jgi:rRNA processing protein Krr1/Pno1